MRDKKQKKQLKQELKNLQTALEKNDYNRSIQLGRKVSWLAERVNDYETAADANFYAAQSQFFLENYDLTLKLLDLSYSHAIKAKDPYRKANTLLNKAVTLALKRDTKEAENTLRKSALESAFIESSSQTEQIQESIYGFLEGKSVKWIYKTTETETNLVSEYNEAIKANDATLILETCRKVVDIKDDIYSPFTAIFTSTNLGILGNEEDLIKAIEGLEYAINIAHTKKEKYSALINITGLHIKNRDPQSAIMTNGKATKILEESEIQNKETKITSLKTQRKGLESVNEDQFNYELIYVGDEGDVSQGILILPVVLTRRELYEQVDVVQNIQYLLDLTESIKGSSKSFKGIEKIIQF